MLHDIKIYIALKKILIRNAVEIFEFVKKYKLVKNHFFNKSKYQRRQRLNKNIQKRIIMKECIHEYFNLLFLSHVLSKVL